MKVILLESKNKSESMLNIADKLHIDEFSLNESKADEQKLISFAGEELAKRFLLNRKKFKSPENDLYYWIKNKTPQDLERAIYEIENSQSKSKLDKEAKGGAQLVCDTEHWKIYHITTFEASQKYGRDTKWCITGVNNYGDKYWNDYTNRGITFYFLITKGEYNPRGNDSKFAIAVYPYEDGYCEVYNQQDERCFLSNVPHYEEINIPGVELNDINEDTAMCDKCGCIIDLSGFECGGFSPDGEPLCNDCFDELCDICYFCDSTVYKEEATYIEDIEYYVCEHCLDSKCDCCEECGEYFTIDSLISKNNRNLCVNCSSEISEGLHTKMKFKLLEEYLVENDLPNEKHDPRTCPKCAKQLGIPLQKPNNNQGNKTPAQKVAKKEPTKKIVAKKAVAKETNESLDITNEVRYAVDNIMKNKDRYPNQDSLESAIYSAIANSFSGMQGVTRDTADMIEDVFEQELERVGLNSLEEDFVYDLEPGVDYYFMHNNHLTKGKFKYKTKAWQVFEREDGEEVRINAWSNVATTPEDIIGVEQVVDRLEKDTKVPNVLHLPNRFVK